MRKKRARFLLSLLDFKLPERDLWDERKAADKFSKEMYICRKLREESQKGNIEYCKLIIQSKYYNDLQKGADKLICYGMLSYHSGNRVISRYINILDLLSLGKFIGLIFGLIFWTGFLVLWLKNF